MQNYRRSEKINCSPATCFSAFTQHIGSWWSARTEGRSDVEGGEFVVHFGKTFKRMRVIEVTTNRAVTWHCIDSYLDLDGLRNRSEWNDTKIRWTIETSESGIRLNVTHSGLNQSLDRYDACERGWDHFFMNSLTPFLESGSGHPFAAASESA